MLDFPKSNDLEVPMFFGREDPIMQMSGLSALWKSSGSAKSAGK